MKVDNKNTNDKIHLRFKTLRLLKKFTIPELSRMTGIAKYKLYHFERGQGGLYMIEFIKLMKCMDLDNIGLFYDCI